MLVAKPSSAALIRTTTAATVFHGGGHEGTLPAKEEAIVNCRILPGETLQSVLGHVRRTVSDERVQCELTDLRCDPSAVSDPGSSDFQMLHRTIREVCPDVLVVPGLTVVATDSRHYASLAAGTFRFLPIRLDEGDLQRVHGIDERISVANYLEMVRFFIRLIDRAAC